MWAQGKQGLQSYPCRLFGVRIEVSIIALYSAHILVLITISGISPSSHFGDSLFLMTFFTLKPVPRMVCRNICERVYSKVVFGISNYSLGQKYCRRCEVYLYNDGLFCPCCGMQLRLTPCSRRCKEILRKRKGNSW